MLSPHWFAGLVRLGGYVAVAILNAVDAEQAQTTGFDVVIDAERA